MIAIIPARGGSKGLPGKNTKLLNGKPLIAYTIEAAIKSTAIDRVFVSTDDKEIAQVAANFGAEVPFLRPDYLAQDQSKAIDAYLYTIDRLINEFRIPIDSFSVLLPTSPLRDERDIDEAVSEFYRNKAYSLISVVEAEHPPSWYKKVTSKGVLVDAFPGVDNSLNRQEADKTYLPNGAIYIFNYNHLKTNLSYYNEFTIPYIMNREKSIDIDTIIDFKLAEIILSDLNK